MVFEYYISEGGGYILSFRDYNEGLVEEASLEVTCWELQLKLLPEHHAHHILCMYVRIKIVCVYYYSRD